MAAISMLIVGKVVEEAALAGAGAGAGGHGMMET